MRSNNSFFVKAIGFGGGALLALLLMAGASYADSIGGPGSTCGTCQGSIYTLSYDGSPLPESPNDPANETFRVSLTIDTSGYNGGGSYLDQVAIKVAPSVVSASLFAAPGGTGLWNLQAGGINNSGCSGSGSGFECANFVAVAPPGVVVPNGTYVWTFDVKVANGDLLTGADQSSIKARYVDASDNKVGALVSEDITLQVNTPEPGTLSLFGSSLIGLAAWLRRRKAMA